jgi:glucuronate isomerase
MANFIHDDFMLSNTAARQLYHDYAEGMPIIDYHNHLIPAHLADNHQFENITEAWLAGDHYKWRAMRANGVEERYITGDATPLEKFVKWSETVPCTLGNPLYHWTHLELSRYFQVEELLNGDTAEQIFHHCSEMLQQEENRARNLVKNKNVRVVCTTDDPTDNLEHHQKLQQQNDIKVLPGFRPDKLYAVNSTDYSSYVERLSSQCDLDITTFKDLLEAANQRIDYFHKLGCRLSDHGLTYLPNVGPSDIESARIFDKVMSGNKATDQELEVFTITMLNHLCQYYAEKDWSQQFHLGAIRNNNSGLLKLLGADVGVDSMGDFPQIEGMSRFLDALNSVDKLTRTIVYNNNPVDNAAFATMMANFNQHPTPGKMQFGASWWFLDQYHGIIAQMQDLSNYGLLSRFVGMLTDSRSFLSFPRHEYFRRIICDELGKDMEAGRLPDDLDLIGAMIQDICYHNAENYFNFE